RADLATLQRIADENGGIRAVGTPGFDASVDAMAAELEEIGFEVTLQEVPYTGFREIGASLTVGDRTFAAPEELHALIYSASGVVAGAVAMLDGSGCDPNDFAGIPDGAIAVTVLGGCFRRDQALNAQAAGAAALVVGYPGRGPGQIYRPTLIDPAGIDIPVVSITDDGIAALDAADGRSAHLEVRTEREPDTLRNVIGELGDGPAVLMLGGHLDSVLDGPGLNDNASGVAALLEIGRALAAEGVPDGWTVRIGLWGGEEFGDIGSRAYVEGMAGETEAYLNLDMAGSLHGAALVYDEAAAPPGSDRITELYEAVLADRGVTSERVDIGGSSDHFAFMQAGVPSGGLFAGAGETGSAAQPSASSPGGEAPDACYHLACDDIDNVDVERVALFAGATHDVAVALMSGG
ncbi:MAG TPA: M20/M25/M40 family metallo-hydrolase, partial [Candidatus Limnocylindria bacterium]|nr:M20/M25/M40 family metallo-hydrolase [Candidatus Limnocylindria bacterium]